MQKFTQESLQSEGKIMVAVKAPWCGPCKALTPILEEIASDGHPVFEVDADEDSDSVARFKVRAVPTILIFEGGKEVERFAGLKSKDELIAALQ